MDYIDNSILKPGEKEYVNQLAARMKVLMGPSLYRHSVGTLEFSFRLAGVNSGKKDLYRLAVSSLVHDYGKVYSTDELKQAMLEGNRDLSNLELAMEPILHSLLGDYLVSRDLGIKDRKILRAVRIHTIGAVSMSPEEKILFVADKVEETRRYTGVEGLRKLALKDINSCLIEVYKNTIIYVINNNNLLHPETSRIWNSICGGK